MKSNGRKTHTARKIIAAIRARKDSLTEDQWSDLDFATQFIFTKWPAFDERPRSSLEMTWSGMAMISFSLIHLTVCSAVENRSFFPEMTTHQGKNYFVRFSALGIRP